MTKAVLGGESEDASAADNRRTFRLRLWPCPASLHASLMARLDRLGPAKEVAQIGAAIGREFSHTYWLTVMRRDQRPNFRSALDRLIRAGLLFRQGVPPHASYYSSTRWCRTLPMARSCGSTDARCTPRIAETLENSIHRDCREPARIVGASLPLRLVKSKKPSCLWGAAGQRSLARSALVEAVEQFRRALLLRSQTLPDHAYAAW